MTRIFINLVVAVLLALQVDVDGIPLVFGWHGLGLALLLIMGVVVIDTYRLIHDL